MSSTEEVKETQAPQSESISLNDLQLVKQIIDLATERGAFRGNELSQVGAVYDRLTKFLAFVAETQAAQEEADTPAEENA